MFHDFCFNMAAELGAIVASLEYQLAPEHRLPAAHDDAMEALHWIKTNPDDVDWLRNYADFSNCYLVGSRAGGNITHHAGLCAAAELNHNHNLIFKIRGLILVQPVFGGSQRNPSELRLINDDFLPMCVTNEDGDGPRTRRLDEIGRLWWRVLVIGCTDDPLVDRQLEAAKLMEEKGVVVVTHFTEGDHHGIQDRDVKEAMQLFGVVKGFISTDKSFYEHLKVAGLLENGE